MGREFELKYAASEASFAAIGRELGPFSVIQMETTYFDTADGALSQRKITLRRRLENGKSICTLKTPGDSFGRGEWDAEGPWSEEIVADLFARAELPAIPIPELSEVCAARFTRQAREITLENCTLEIALDKGILLAGDRELPLLEVELELKFGSEAALLAWAEDFSQKYQLKIETKSKSRRAMDLAKGG